MEHPLQLRAAVRGGIPGAADAPDQSGNSELSQQPDHQGHRPQDGGADRGAFWGADPAGHGTGTGAAGRGSRHFPGKSESHGRGIPATGGNAAADGIFCRASSPAELAVRAYKLYGDSTVELLYDDPYLLMDEGLDAPFGAVDRFAIELGVAGDDPRRVEAGILFELNYNLTAGHSFLPEDKLQLAVSQLLSVDGEAVKQGIGRLLEADRLVRSTLAGITVNYLPRLYEAEVNCSRRLLEFRKGQLPAAQRLGANDPKRGGGKRRRILRGTDTRHPGSGDLRTAADHRRPRHR